MRTIRQTSSFKRDLKREAKGKHRRSLQTDFTKIIEILARDLQLPENYRDHALAGDWKDHRDCHVKPDLVLIYRKPDPDTVQLVRLGSHAELGIG
jgi:mRNA interferase YafQ